MRPSESFDSRKIAGVDHHLLNEVYLPIVNNKGLSDNRAEVYNEDIRSIPESRLTALI